MAPQPEADVDQHRELFERSADAILIIDADRFVDCNQATVDMLRYRSREELLQTHPSELSPEKQPDGRRSFDKADEMMDLAFERGSLRFGRDHLLPPNSSWASSCTTPTRWPWLQPPSA